MQTCREAQGQAWSKGGCWKFVSSHPIWLGKSDVLLGHTWEEPCLGGISESRIHQATSTAGTCLSTSNHPSLVGKTGSLGSAHVSKGRIGQQKESGEAPGWASLARERLSGDKTNFWCFPKGRGGGYHCLNWKFLIQWKHRHGFGGGSH